VREENESMFRLNQSLLDIPVYASKAISLQAKSDPSIMNLSFGEPTFGPPEHLLAEIASEDLSLHAFVDSAKRYEDPRGSLALREAIASWYQRRYGLKVNPQTEVMVTHGGVEAITLALLCTSEVGDEVAISDPSYMLYRNTVGALGRRCRSVARAAGPLEYAQIFADPRTAERAVGAAKAMIVNSPENPTGYVVDQAEWQAIAEHSARTGLWIIHDEVYDVMDFKRSHVPAKTVGSLSEGSILINSFSKKFGLPGLRIGWMVAPERMITLASKVHDYLYLGVNIQYERIATRLLVDEGNASWFSQVVKDIQGRAERAVTELGEAQGFGWKRAPLGAMFLFPSVRGVYERLPDEYRAMPGPVGDVVAQYLLKQRGVAVVPGSVYGSQGDEHVRMVLCTSEAVFNNAIDRLRSAAEPRAPRQA
jgi:aspartate/methionine/tyrosine aminotransferase